MLHELFLLCALIGIIQTTSSAGQTSPSTSPNSGLFAADLFRQISKAKTTENVIISPISVQTALAMVYLGAEGETANELVKGLRLPSGSKEEVGSSFAAILNARSGEAELNIANRLYVSSTDRLRTTFNDLARKYFNSEAEPVNFSQSANAIETINTWVEQKTNNKITNLLQPGSVDSDTSAIIVNAIYFKGKWLSAFDAHLTRDKPFWVSPTKSVDVQTMKINEESFKCGEFPELDATAIELPYKNSDISMIIILPNERDGLGKLEQKLSSVAINQLVSRLTSQDVSVLLPKFKIEFTIGLVDVLKELGILSIFEDRADLSGIFESNPNIAVSDVQHKAFIDVNEAGSEAAAASFAKLYPRSGRLTPPKYFNADHPFVFAITGPETVYFVGHIAKL